MQGWVTIRSVLRNSRSASYPGNTPTFRKLLDLNCTTCKFRLTYQRKPHRRSRALLMNTLYLLGCIRREKFESKIVLIGKYVAP